MLAPGEDQAVHLLDQRRVLHDQNSHGLPPRMGLAGGCGLEGKSRTRLGGSRERSCALGLCRLNAKCGVHRVLQETARREGGKAGRREGGNYKRERDKDKRERGKKEREREETA
jgi:hypothetical protein